MARKGARGAGTPATVALERAGVAFEVHAYEHDPRAESYGLEAAEALGVEPSRVFKTLMVQVQGGDLEARYTALEREYRASEASAKAVRQRIADKTR